MKNAQAASLLNPLFTLQGHQQRVWNCAWHPTGKTIASCSSDKSVIIWSYDLVAKQFVLREKLSDFSERSIRAVDWHPGGKQLAAGSFDGNVYIMMESGGETECVATLEGHENEIKCVEWNKDGSLLASCSRDKTVHVWNGQDLQFDIQVVLQGHTQDVKSVRWNPMRQELISTSYDDTIRTWHYDIVNEEWEEAQVINGHTSTVWDASFHQSGNYFCTVSDDRKLGLWKYDEVNQKYNQVCFGPPPQTQPGSPQFQSQPLYSCNWGPGNLLATGGGDNRVCVWKINLDASHPESIFQLKEQVTHALDVNCVRWNQNLLASACDDGSVQIFQLS